MSFLVNGLTDVEGGEGREDQSLNGTGEQAKEHDRDWQEEGNKENQNRNNQFISKDVSSASSSLKARWILLRTNIEVVN